MLYKRYINEFLEEPIYIEFWCFETEEENEKFDKFVKKLKWLNYFIGG